MNAKNEQQIYNNYFHRHKNATKTGLLQYWVSGLRVKQAH
jgi:hypothetical protein